MILTKTTKLTAERIRDIRKRHTRYNPQPIHEMTDVQARAFAMRQAVMASATIDMTEEEMELYAGAIYGSIRRFNHQDRRHREHMAYIEACQVTLQAMIERRRKVLAERKKKPRVIDIK